jgi:hypothetical protein
MLLAAFASALVAVVAAGCGSRSTLDASPNPDGGVPAGEGGPPVEASTPGSCGDGVCSPSESCTTCSVDCGVCSTCGNGVCDPSETCGSCPRDCDVCPTCGDGFCTGDETCESCAPDCHVCPACGDGTCQSGKEDCFSCPGDCGVCPGCGDGMCDAPETCASCEQDCGVCAVCGNDVCEGPFETCVNCPGDCGECTTLGCLGMLTCAIPCLGLTSTPPDVNPTCAADCVARGCASAASLFDQLFTCLLDSLPNCQPASLDCLEAQCASPLAACVAAKCKTASP